jgi:hypothetical protein
LSIHSIWSDFQDVSSLVEGDRTRKCLVVRLRGSNSHRRSGNFCSPHEWLPALRAAGVKRSVRE